MLEYLSLVMRRPFEEVDHGLDVAVEYADSVHGHRGTGQMLGSRHRHWDSSGRLRRGPHTRLLRRSTPPWLQRECRSCGVLLLLLAGARPHDWMAVPAKVRLCRTGVVATPRRAVVVRRPVLEVVDLRRCLESGGILEGYHPQRCGALLSPLGACVADASGDG